MDRNSIPRNAYFVYHGDKPGTYTVRYTDEDGNHQSVTFANEANGGADLVPARGPGSGGNAVIGRFLMFIRKHDWQLLGLVVGLASMARGIALATPGMAAGRSFEPYERWMPVEVWGALLAVAGIILLATLVRPSRYAGGLASMLLFGLWFWQAMVALLAGVTPQAVVLFSLAFGAGLCYAKIWRGDDDV